MADRARLGSRCEVFERLYRRFNRREFVRADPLRFLYDYEDPGDREIVGLVASVLAYGRVDQICRSVMSVLARIPSPARFVAGESERALRGLFKGFRHRFTTGDEMGSLLVAVRRARRDFGSLQACFAAGLREEHDTVLPALATFSACLRRSSPGLSGFLVPSPDDGSACKRLNLFLRWMVRRDDVDPGGWDAIPASKLIVPVDTHMHRICAAIGLTRRRQANLRAALEITAAFRAVVPDDPVRYDFAMTRLGIWPGADVGAFVRAYGELG